MSNLLGLHRGHNLPGLIGPISGGAPPPIPTDGPNNWRVPTKGDFGTLELAGVPNPTSLYLCQDASGNILDSQSVNHLSPLGTVSYSNAVAGWSRVGFGLPTGNNRFVSQAPALDPAATSVMMLAYVALTGGAGSGRAILGASFSSAGSSGDCRIGHTSTNLEFGKCANNTVNGVQAVQGIGVIPFLLRYDRTNSNMIVASHLEKITCTYNAAVTSITAVNCWLGFGGSVVASAAMSVVWACVWTGADAELSDADTKTRLQAFNITIPWT